MIIQINEIFEPELKQYDPEVIDSVAQGIKDVGQLHPIIVHKIEPGMYNLVTGGKRLQAVRKLKLSCILATVLEGDFTPDQLEEYSITENLRRDNKNWYDVIELHAKLHDLRIRQNGAAKNGVRRDRGNTGWSGSDTAAELGIARGSLSEDLQIANAIASNPQLKNVKDRKTALQLIRSISKRETAQEEAQLDSEFKMNQVFLGDSVEILKNIPDNTFDACITDPPWLLYKVEELTQDKATMLVFDQIYKKLKFDSFLYVVVGFNEFQFYTDYLTKLGFSVQKYPLIWRKPRTITHGRRIWEYARDYEPIIVAVKGCPSLTTGIEMSAITEHQNMHHTHMIHPHEKPISLINEILQQCSYPGSKILDPFAGSGVVAAACKISSRPYIVIERDADRYSKIQDRLAKISDEVITELMELNK